jgi:hypothetical protein
LTRGPLVLAADDFDLYYSLALQGAFFDHDETLNEFRPHDPATVHQFFSAINTALTLVKNSFS